MMLTFLLISIVVVVAFSTDIDPLEHQVRSRIEIIFKHELKKSLCVSFGLFSGSFDKNGFPCIKVDNPDKYFGDDKSEEWTVNILTSVLSRPFGLITYEYECREDFGEKYIHVEYDVSDFFKFTGYIIGNIFKLNKHTRCNFD